MKDRGGTTNGAISIQPFLMIYAALVALLLLLGSAYPEEKLRIELHEQAHLQAFRLQGIEAERTSFALVESAALTELGVLAGYRRDIVNSEVGALLSWFTAGVLFVSWKRSPVLSALPVWSLSAWAAARRYDKDRAGGARCESRFWCPKISSAANNDSKRGNPC